ncbi:hypothetical protein [Streptomyces albipurpureus]|uniref:hypothetical protein n=1 Tax=Streptomyces albipurpureus TaxID=2897419 RepID=UPI003CE55849
MRVPRLRLGRPRERPDRFRADKAYDSRKNRAYLSRRGITATIPVPDGSGPQPPETGLQGWSATEVRQGRRQRASRGRMRH